MATQLLFIGTTELLLIGDLALLLFGRKKLPEMMKGLGQGVQSFKKGMKEPIEEEQEDNENQKESVEAEAEIEARADAKQSGTTATDAGK